MGRLLRHCGVVAAANEGCSYQDYRDYQTEFLFHVRPLSKQLIRLMSKLMRFHHINYTMQV